MEFVLLTKEEAGATKYVYENTISKKISYDFFKSFVRKNSKNNELPELYVIKDNGQYIGYLLLLADKKEDIPKPFTFLACHNGDQLPIEQHKKILEFIKIRAKKKGWKTLLWLAENEM